MKRGKLLRAFGATCLLTTPALVPAHDIANGSTSSRNVLINTVGNNAVNWNIIRSVRIVIPADDVATHRCVATASADMDQSGGEGDAQPFTVRQHRPWLTHPGLVRVCKHPHRHGRCAPSRSSGPSL